MTGRRLPPLNWLRAFEASARHLSFTGAADELGMTQSAVSQQIKSLEGYLERPVFQRQPKGLELTEAGRTFLPAVRDAFETLEIGTRGVVGTGYPRALLIESNLSFAVHWLAPRLGDFYASCPDAVVEVRSNLWEPPHALTDADIEIRFSLRPPTGAKVTRLTNETFYPVAAPDYDIRDRTLENERLFDCSWVLCSWDNWFADQSQTRPKTAKLTYSSTLAVSLNAAVAGAGLAMAHDTVAGGLIKRGLLIKPFEHETPMQEGYFLQVMPSAESDPVAQAFVRWITTAFADQIGS